MQSTGKTLIDWIELYNKKSKEQFCLLPEATMWATNEHGFITWQIVGGELWVRHCSCDAKYWLPIIVSFANGIGAKRILTTTRRNPKAMMKVLGCEYLGEKLGRHVLMLEVNHV